MKSKKMIVLVIAGLFSQASVAQSTAEPVNRAEVKQVVYDVPPPAAAPLSPVVMNPDAQQRKDVAARKIPLHVKIIGGQEELWNDTLLLEGFRGASVKLVLDQANDACPETEQRLRRRRAASGINFSISNRSRNEDAPFSVDVSWSRPSRNCDMPGSMTVSMKVQTQILPGETKELQGDGGLKLLISRPE